MSFRDRYDELFGPSDPYEPLDMGPFGSSVPKRSALPTSPADTMPDDPLYTPDLSPRKGGGDSGFFENMGRQFGAGVVQTGEMVLGGAEYVARQNSLLDGIVADTIYSGRSGLAGVREDILGGINREDLDKAAREWTTLDPNRTIWQGGPLEFVESVLYKASNALPATLATLYPPIKLAKMGLSTQALVAMGASEGVLSMGGIANQIADEIIAQPSEQLIKDSPRFAQLLEEYGGDADAAKDQLIKEAQGFAPLIGGAAVAGISSVAGRYFTPIFEKTGGAPLGQRLARGFAAEAPAEGSQGAVEQFTQNYAARIYDADRQLSEGVAEAFVGEGAIGGLMGAGFAGAFGERPAPPAAPPPDLAARPDLTEQLGLPGIEPGGPADTLPDELDQPTPEPAQDLLAQIDDLVTEGTTRRGVYIAPGTDERYVKFLMKNLPPELTLTRNVDGKGGHLITKSAELGYRAQEAIRNGAGVQETIGRILGIGRGKPTSPDSRVVQLLAPDGSVARESMVANQQEADALAAKWGKEKAAKDLRVAILSPQEAVSRRQELSRFGLPAGNIPVQEDMFNNTARGTDVVPVPPDQGPPGQLDLPLPYGRERGVGRVNIPPAGELVGPPEGIEYQTRGGESRVGPTPTDADPDLPYDVERPRNQRQDPYEVSRHQYGMDFREPVTETVTTTQKRQAPTPDIAVQVVSDKGEILEEHRFGTPEFAEQKAEELRKQFPEYNIRTAPATRETTEVRTRAKVTPRGPIEPVYEQPIDEEVQDEIRARVPFDERLESTEKVKGVRSFGQAADRLIGEAAGAYQEEQQAMIGGFYHPDRLTFNNPDYEAAYRKAWNTLSKMRSNEMTDRRRKLLNELGKVRQLDKPKLDKPRSEKFFAAARAVNPARVREFEETVIPEKADDGAPKEYGTATAQRNVAPDFLGDFKSRTREQIDNLADYVVRHKTKASKTWTEESFSKASEAYARRDELKKRYPKRQVTVDVKGTRALDEEFERAVIFREGREANPAEEQDEVIKVEVKEQDAEEEAADMELTGQLSFGEEEKAEKESVGQKVKRNPKVKRSWYTTPGRKLRFIRRESEHARRREVGQKSIKTATVRRTAKESTVERRPGEAEQNYIKRLKRSEKGQKLNTAPLTQTNLPLDESVEKRVQRIAKAKEVRKELGASATKAAVELRKMKAASQKAGFFDTMSDKFKKDFIYARDYLDQLIQFARSVQRAKNDSNEAIALAEGVKKMLDAVENIDYEVFAEQWGALARANTFDDLANLKYTTLSKMRDQGKRTADALERNRDVVNRENLRKWAEQMKGDKLYEGMIKPLLEKMSQYVLDTVNGINTMPYIPSPLEVSEIKFALNMNKDRADFDPIRKQLKEVGFEFDENGNVTSFLASENYLGARFNERFKGVPEKTPGEIARIAGTIDLRAQQRQARVEEAKRQGKEPEPEDVTAPIVPVNDRVHTLDTVDATDQTIEQAMANLTHNKKVISGKAKARVQAREVTPGLLTIDAVNGLIERFKRATAPAKTTWSGLKRQEARFIRGLKQLGVWRQTGESIGVIDIAGVKSKTYRLVGPRFETMYRADAREHIQKLASFPIPKDMLSDVRAARKDTEATAGLQKFLDAAAMDLFNEAAGPVRFDAEYTGVVERVGDMMLEGTISGQDVVDAILEIAPKPSFYHSLATRLSRKDMADVKVKFGEESDFPKGQLGRYKRGSKTILINRDALAMHRINNDEVLAARVVHTLTHELVHHQTHAAIDSNPALRQHLTELQARARKAWADRVGGKTPYGLKVLTNSQNEVHEFVAEAFSNHEFQTFLKETPRAPQTLGDLFTAFVEAVRRALGLGPREVKNNLFDAVLMTEDVLFDDAGFGGSVSQGDLYLSGDAVLDNISTHVQGLLEKSTPFWDKVKNASRNLMTFEQLHDTYAKHFTDGSFAKYMDAWKRRNSAISRNMKVPEKLSVKWTELETKNPEAAVELSRIGTEATIDKLTPSMELTAKERAEVSPKRLARYDALRARYNALPVEAKNLYQELRAYYKSAQAEEANLLLDAALRGILTKGKGAPLTTEQFRAKFPREVIAKLAGKEDIAKALKDIIDPDELAPLVKQVQRLASLRTISYGDYFPLMRYGDYTVYKEVKHPDRFFTDLAAARAERARLLEENPTLDIGVFEKGGKVVMRIKDIEFWMFEKKTEAQKKATELGVTVEARLPREGNGTAISSNAELTAVLNTLSGNPAAQAAIKNHYLKSLSDQSFRKHELKRKNRKGVNYDLQHRNLANYLKQSAYYRAQLEHGWRMGEALEDMRMFTRGRRDTAAISTEQLQQVYKNVVDRDTMTNDPSELNKWVSGGVNITQFMMLTSPSYWMINATQPWLVTMPIMGGKYGYGNSMASLKYAMNLVKAPLTKEAMNSWFGMKALTKDKVAVEKAFNVVDQLIDHIKTSGDPRANEYITLIEELRDQNIIDINVLTELRQIADGVRGGLWQNTLDASRILAHITEVSNRTMTAIAAYNLAKNAGESMKDATQYAADMVSQTQFNYSSENKPPLFQKGGPLKWAAPLMFQFMQWPQHMYALLIRNVAASVRGKTKKERRAALKSLVGLLGTHAAVGGMVGMTLQPIKWAFGMLMWGLGDDDEPYTFANAINGRTFDNLIAEVMSELFGNQFGRALSHGLPTLLGTDLSARMSMGTLYFVDLRGDTAEGILGSVMASFGGATLNQAINWGNSLQKIANGELYRGVEQGMPKIIRDVLRAGRYYNEGLVNNAGDTVIDAKDFSFYEAFLQGIGFSPDEVSKFYSGQAAIKGAQGYARDRRESLIAQFVKDGMSSGVLKDVLEFNRAYPSLRITRSTLIRGARIQVEREARYRREGANIDAKEARDFSKYGDPYR